MAITTITYDDKSDLNTTATPSVNKVAASDMNEIKNVVNTNANLQGDLANLNTTEKSSIVGAINEMESKKAIKLWENGSPFVNFSPQNIAFSSSDYDYFDLYYYDWTTNKNMKCVRVIKGNNALLDCTMYNSSDEFYMASRYATYNSATSYSIGSCKTLYGKTSVQVATDLNFLCVPAIVYGYKF